SSLGLESAASSLSNPTFVVAVVYGVASSLSDGESQSPTKVERDSRHRLSDRFVSKDSTVVVTTPTKVGGRAALELRPGEPEVADDVDEEVGGAGGLSGEDDDGVVGAQGNDRVVGASLTRRVVDGGGHGQGDSEGIDREMAEGRGLGHGDVDRDGVGFRRDAARSGQDEGAAGQPGERGSAVGPIGIARIGQTT